MAIYHAYTQTVADGTATSVVRPSDWNSGHVQGFFLAGNTSNASSVTGTDIYLSGGNGVTLSGSNNSIGISVGTGFNVSVSNTSSQLTQLAFPNSNGITWGLTNGSITANIPMLISANNGTGSPATLSFQDGGGVSWSTNANGIQASVAAGGGATLSYMEWPRFGGVTSGTYNTAQALIVPVSVPTAVVGSVMRFAGSVSTQATTTQSISGSISGGVGSVTGDAFATTQYVGWIFSKNSTGNTALFNSSKSGSASYGLGMRYTISNDTNASSASVSWSTSGYAVYPVNIDSTGGVTYSTSGASGSGSFSSTSTNAATFSSSAVMTYASAALSGIRQVMIPMPVTMTAGNYLVGMNSATGTATTSAGTYISGKLSVLQGALLYSTFAGTVNQWGNVNTFSSLGGILAPVGLYSTSRFSSTVGNVGGVSAYSNNMLYFNIEAYGSYI